ncbi:hypothetical protein GOP47_0005770 [Adiantum capillus-veneris]|uniref:F-box domain-containing protein n=1 Tax=Adiantum capillus-veneris TaxID=13818 RepID=A0A9D4ZNV0_ADICA|nr:hypothetical protein GOP47_0005770 [Adiantum capillus-veneris]
MELSMYRVVTSPFHQLLPTINMKQQAASICCSTSSRSKKARVDSPTKVKQVIISSSTRSKKARVDVDEFARNHEDFKTITADVLLPKLPVPCLLRFRSVCKAWNAAVMSPVAAQTTHKGYSYFILSNTFCKSAEQRLAFLDPLTLASKSVSPPFPLPSSSEARVLFLHSSQGLLGLLLYNLRTCASTIRVWNVVNNSWKELPPCPLLASNPRLQEPPLAIVPEALALPLLDNSGLFENFFARISLTPDNKHFCLTLAGVGISIWSLATYSSLSDTWDVDSATPFSSGTSCIEDVDFGARSIFPRNHSRSCVILDGKPIVQEARRLIPPILEQDFDEEAMDFCDDSYLYDSEEDEKLEAEGNEEEGIKPEEYKDQDVEEEPEEGERVDAGAGHSNFKLMIKAYDATSKQWKEAHTMEYEPPPYNVVKYGALLECRGRLFMVGKSKKHRDVEIWEGVSGAWRNIATMPSCFGAHYSHELSCLATDSSLILVGHDKFTCLYNLAQATWTPLSFSPPPYDIGVLHVSLHASSCILSA